MAAVNTELSRDLSLFDVTMIGVGAMIGAGIFVLTGIAAGAAGPALILAFSLNGIITVFTAMAYAELGSAIPEAGGGYLWVREALPGPNAFQAGWMSWFAHAVAGSLYALGFGSYISLVLNELGVTFIGPEGGIAGKVFAVIIILIFLGINFRGVSETGMAGNIITVLKILILGFFIISGIWAIYRNPEFLTKFADFAPNGWGGIVTAMGLTFIAFEGYEIIVQAGEEVKSPRTNIPKAVFLSLAVVIPIYMLVAFVSIGAVTPDTPIATYQWLAEHAELGVAEAARQFMPLGTVLLLIGGILSTMSALNATTFSSTRVSFAMGRDRNLPKAFAEINPWTRTPYKALMFSGALILFMAIAIPIEDVAAAADVMFLLLFLQVNVAVIIIRRKYGARLRYGYLMPFFPVIPIVVIGIKFLLAIFMFRYSPTAWYFTILWLAVGFGIYYLYAKPRKREEERTPIIMEERLAVEGLGDGYTVLVPIANPASLPVLIQPALNAARRQNGSVILLNVITVPDQLPLSAGRRYLKESRALTELGAQIVEADGVRVQTLVRIAHNAADAIIQTTEEHNIDLLIMGWRGDSHSTSSYIGSNIDRIVREVNCESLIVQSSRTPPFEKILVPIADPMQIQSALDAAGYFCDGGCQQIDVVHVFRPEATEDEKTKYLQTLEAAIAKSSNGDEPNDRPAVTIRTDTDDDVVQTISRVSKGYDCVVVGMTRDSWLKQRFLGSRPAQLAAKLEPPMILVQPRTGSVAYGIYRMRHYMHGGYRIVEPAAEKELTDQGILMPARKAESLTPPTLRQSLPTLVAGIGAIAGVVIMYTGYGTSTTWYGAGLYLVSLLFFTGASLHAISTYR
ncbi:MAG: amino acid permease [Caldilineaceae bacterium]